MAKENYVVLKTDRSAESRPRTRGPGGPTVVPFDTPTTELEVHALEAGEAAELAAEDDVQAVAPSIPLQLVEPFDAEDGDLAPTDDDSVTWGVRAVGADTSPMDGTGVVVAVLDTGIEADHPAFDGVNLELKNFTDDEDHDVHGHGTHCAGTVFGQDVDGRRIGVARNVDKALIGKVLGRRGASTADLASAIQWALGNGANVISMSLGIDFPGYVKDLITRQGVDERLATAIALEGYVSNVDLYRSLADFMKSAEVFQQASTIVAASGNESERNANPPLRLNVAPPAAARGIRSVGAIGQSAGGFTVASFSNAKADLVAPGVGVVSATIGGRLRALNGTSMATPHVAGVTALWAQKLLKDQGGFNIESLESKVLAGAVQEGFADGFEQIDIGAGLARAPQ